MKTLKKCACCKEYFTGIGKEFCSQICYKKYLKGRPSWNRGLGETRSTKGKNRWKKAMKGLCPWNKGLTKETDLRVNRMSIIYPTHRKSPIYSKELLLRKKLHFSGRNNPNYNPNKSEFEKYKILCKFSFDLGKYPNEFDLDKLKKMFHPFKNRCGYTRDHIVPIFYGFKNNINPIKIRHPANCQLLLHAENSRKNKFSNMSESDLNKRIKLWNKKYGVFK